MQSSYGKSAIDDMPTDAGLETAGMGSGPVAGTRLGRRLGQASHQSVVNDLFNGSAPLNPPPIPSTRQALSAGARLDGRRYGVTGQQALSAGARLDANEPEMVPSPVAESDLRPPDGLIIISFMIINIMSLQDDRGSAIR